MKFIYKARRKSSHSALALALIAQLASCPVALAETPSAKPVERHGFQETVGNGANGVASSLGFTSTSSAESKQGKQACKTHRDKDAALDPCHEAEVSEVAGQGQVVSAGVYAIATAICSAECAAVALFGAGSTGRACAFAGLGAMAADAAAGTLVGSKGKDIISPLLEALPGVGMQAMGLMMSGAGSVIAGSATEASGTQVACLGALLNAVQCGTRVLNAKASYDQAGSAYVKKLDLLSKNEELKVTASSSQVDPKKNGVVAQQGTPKMIQNPGSGSSELNGATLAEAAATGENGPLIRAFEQMTGKPASELYDKMLAGVPPILAAAEMTKDTLGEKGMATAADLNQASEPLATKFKDKFNELDKTAKPQSSIAFEASKSGSSGATAKANSGMPDLGALMASLMPKQPGAKDQGPQGTKGVSFSPNLRAPASADADGIHTAHQSIFDVVGARYQQVQNKFLAGDAVISNKPVSLVPRNPYLKQ